MYSVRETTGTPCIDCDCRLENPLTIVYGHHMDDGSVFVDFARHNDGDFVTNHRAIYVYLCEADWRIGLDAAAVDIVNVNRETLETEFDNPLEFDSSVRGVVEESDLVLKLPQDLFYLYAFSTRSYQTGNSRMVMYAIEKGMAHEDRDVRLRGARGDVCRHRAALHQRRRCR